MYGCNLYLQTKTRKIAWHKGASMYADGRRPRRWRPPQAPGAPALFHAIPTPFQASPDGALISSPLRAGLIRRHAPVRLRGVESRLALRPLVALVLVTGLVLLGLPVLRVHKHIPVLTGRRRRCFSAGGVRVTGWIDNFVLLSAVAPSVIRVVGVIVRGTTVVNRGVVRRKYRNKHTDGRADHY